MARFVMMYHQGDTPEEPTQETMDSWMSWFRSLGDAVVDMGSPFLGSTTIAPGGEATEGSGPHPATGYTVIEAADMEAAAALAGGCPGLASGGSVRLYEAAQMG